MKKINNYLETIITMQTLNYYKQYDKTKEIYEKYYTIIPNDTYLQNKALNEYEIANKQFILKSKPSNLQLVLFDKCFSNCIMCNQHKMNYFLPEKYIKEIVFDYLPYLDTILWQGGEVFLWEQFTELLKSISIYKRITQTIITNCQNLNSEIIKKLVSLNNIKLIISIDSINKEIYETIRNGSSFDKLIKNISILNKYKYKFKSNITLNINFVILKENYMEIPNIVDFATKYHFDSITFNECISTDNYVNNFSKYIENIINTHLNLAIAKATKNNIRITVQHKKFSYKKEKDITMSCKLPWTKLLLGEYNSFAPECVCLKRENYYNTDTIKNIWNSKLMQTYRKHILEIKQSNNICNSNCRLYGHKYFN